MNGGASELAGDPRPIRLYNATMRPFVTEFPVKTISDRAIFVAQVVAWLRGANYSTVLDEPRDADLGRDTAHVRAPNGEELRLRELSTDGVLEAIGFRHEYPDAEGRLWRTEAVLRRAVSTSAQDLVRLRTECVAREPGVRLDFPRKPYLVKMILQDGWGGNDGHLLISDKPLWLADDEAGRETAKAVTIGQASQYLPVIYVSAAGTSEWLLSPDQTNKLAFDLGGIAHVVVEPNRAFSFNLRDLTDGRNVFGGTLGIAVPGRGIIRRYYLGIRLPDVEDLLAFVREVSISIRSQMSAEGWDWTELQEQSLRRQRERDRNRLSLEEIEKFYQEEIENLQDRVRQLDAQIAVRSPEDAMEFEDGLFPADVVKTIGLEIYPGEFSDRLRLAAKECCSRAEQIGLDHRSKHVLEAIAARLPSSHALAELLEDLKRATKDSKRLAPELTALLLRLGSREGRQQACSVGG
jgi:hypothetical protein